MLYVGLGCIGFFFLLIFDYNKMNFAHKLFNINFLICSVFIAYASIMLIIGDFPIIISFPFLIKILFFIFAAISLSLMIYSLFFALPFDKTYVHNDSVLQVIDYGMYGLSRHPGVIWFFFTYLFLWLATGNIYMLYACIVWTLLDITHVYIQDKIFFPASINGYDEYKEIVPFLIPNKNSINRFMTTILTTIRKRD